MTSSETVFEEIKRYVRLDTNAARQIHPFRAIAEKHFVRIADEVHGRIGEHPDARAVFSSAAQAERHKASLVRWMARICTGPYDQAHFDESAKIGRAHVRVGLPQRFMFTALSLMRETFDEVAREECGAEAEPIRRLLNKVLDVELAVMLETYREDTLAQKQALGRLEREQVGRLLAQTEHRYKNAVELASVLILGLDKNLKIRLFNAQAEHVTGFAREQVRGALFCQTLLAETLFEEHAPVFERAAAGLLDRKAPIDSAIRTQSGEVREVRWHLAHSHAEADDEVVLFAIGQDITDEKTLAGRLRQSEKLAAIGTLAAGLAHEIRNPLNGAQLHVTFLEKGLKRMGIADADTTEALGVVRDEIRRLSGLVTEFLDFARPRPLTLEPASVRAICERVAGLALGASEAESITLKVDLPAVDITVHVDPGKMEQVLLNLIRNAVEALESSGGTVILRARRSARSVVFEVEDDGPGLADPTAPVFDPFFSTKPQGTGLGLAIVHRIVTDHQGTIDLQSRPGKTVFHIVIPL